MRRHPARNVREVAAGDAVAWVKAVTPTGTRAHAVATDDPRFEHHGAHSWGTARCGVMAKRTHYRFRPNARNACASCRDDTA